MSEFKTFENIECYPIINPTHPSVGGPQWPSFDKVLNSDSSNFYDNYERLIIGQDLDDSPLSEERKLKADKKQPLFKKLKGNWLWGGFLVHHIGHFIADFFPRAINSMSYLDDFNNFNGIIFSGRKVTKEYLKVLTELCSYIGIQNDKIFINESKILIERLVVFPQGEIRCNRTPPSFRYLDFLNSRQIKLIKKITPSNSFNSLEEVEKVYLSRSKWHRGKILGSQLIERILKNQGYKILFPGECSNMDIIAILSSAKKIIIDEGSASHFLQLIFNPNASVLLISRSLKKKGGMIWPILYHVNANKYSYAISASSVVYFKEDLKTVEASAILEIKELGKYLNTFDSSIILDSYDYQEYKQEVKKDVNNLSSVTNFYKFSSPAIESYFMAN